MVSSTRLTNFYSDEEVKKLMDLHQAMLDLGKAWMLEDFGEEREPPELTEEKKEFQGKYKGSIMRLRLSTKSA